MLTNEHWKVAGVCKPKCCTNSRTVIKNQPGNTGRNTESNKVCKTVNLIVARDEKSDSHSSSVDHGSLTETYWNLSRHCWDISAWTWVMNQQIQHVIFTWWPFSFNVTRRRKSYWCVLKSCKQSDSDFRIHWPVWIQRDQSVLHGKTHVWQPICYRWTTDDFQWVTG